MIVKEVKLTEAQVNTQAVVDLTQSSVAGQPPSLDRRKVLLQDSGVPVHLPPVRAGHSPPGLYNDRKGSETNGPLKRTQNSAIPGRLADSLRRKPK